MIKIHDNFYMNESIQFIYNNGLLYVEDEKDRIVFNEGDLEDLIWFIKNVIKKDVENEKKI